MAVANVWGLIDGVEEIAVRSEGNAWIFNLPASKTGEVIVEVWAEDEAGNQDYRAGVFTLDRGAVKSFRWTTEYSQCTMRSFSRTCELLDPGAVSVMRPIPRISGLQEFRPLCTMLPHVRNKGECRCRQHSTERASSSSSTHTMLGIPSARSTPPSTRYRWMAPRWKVAA